MFKSMILACAMAFTFIGGAQADPTSEYRMWSAEQMINRITEKKDKFYNLCDRIEVKTWNHTFSEECKGSVANFDRSVAIIRQVAMSGDAVMWAKIVDLVHKMEVGIQPALNNAK